MNKKIILLFQLSGLLLLGSCNKNSDIFIPDPGQPTGIDSAWVSSITSGMPVSMMKNDLLLEAYKDSFEVSASSPALSSPAGMYCTFSPNSCVNGSGLTVTGRVQAEMLLLKKKGDLIRMNRPTSSNGYMLVTGGVVYLRLQKDGQPVSLASNAAVNIYFSDTAPSSLMKYYKGDETNPDQFNWLPETAITSLNNVFSNNQNYRISSNNLRWISCENLFDPLGAPIITVNTVLPSNYTNANTEVFLVFNDIRSVLGMYGTPLTKKFSVSRVPSSKGARIIVLSRQGNDYFFKAESITTGSPAGSSVQEVHITPLKTGIIDIKNYLASL